jgi:hypothetical protein
MNSLTRYLVISFKETSKNNTTAIIQDIVSDKGGNVEKEDWK